MPTIRASDNPVLLKDGKAVRLESYRPEDKEALISMYASLSPEAIKWGLPPYDRARIERWTSNPANTTNLIARSEERIVGHLQMFSMPFSRRKGVADLFIYIHQGFQNVGLGTAMMQKAIEMAKEKGIHRLGLTVVADNRRAIKVYEKVGFKKEGIARDTFYSDDGRYHDEVQMGITF